MEEFNHPKQDLRPGYRLQKDVPAYLLLLVAWDILNTILANGKFYRITL
jgi:hypothetical protein